MEGALNITSQAASACLIERILLCVMDWTLKRLLQQIEINGKKICGRSLVQGVMHWKIPQNVLFEFYAKNYIYPVCIAL